jgi:hypothetical protein
MARRREDRYCDVAVKRVSTGAIETPAWISGEDKVWLEGEHRWLMWGGSYAHEVSYFSVELIG